MKKLNGFQKLAVITVAATLFLIFVGGLVRAAGAGLGCPDWPRCFGMWIPPLNAADLPPGFDPEAFNVVHTWLEYVNRLTGVVIGLLITATFISSFRYRNSDRVVTVSAAAAFFLVLLQGWLGGQVVRSGLSEGLITLHMILAMVIVSILLFTAFRVNAGRLHQGLSTLERKPVVVAATLLLLFLLVQLVLGTQVREQIDMLKNAPHPLPRDAWISELESGLYFWHRSFSWLVLLAGAALWQLTRTRFRLRNPALERVTLWILFLILLQIVLGVGMEWYSVPGAFQVLHLLGSAILLCTIVLYLLMTGVAGGVNRAVSKE